jgi:hypothetical protein
MLEETMIECSKCGKPLGEGEHKRPVAAMSGSIMGDEYTESWYFCPDCQVYSLENHRDRFLGEEEVSVRDPIDKATGDAKVASFASAIHPGTNAAAVPHTASTSAVGWIDLPDSLNR